MPAALCFWAAEAEVVSMGEQAKAAKVRIRMSFFIVLCM